MLELENKTQLLSLVSNTIHTHTARRFLHSHTTRYLLLSTLPLPAKTSSIACE